MTLVIGRSSLRLNVPGFLEPEVVECDVSHLLVVGDLAWPEDSIPSVSLAEDLTSCCSLLPNLEGPILPAQRPPLASGRWFGLWNSARTVDFLMDMKTRVAGGAGNHIVDFRGGLEATFTVCRRAGIHIGGAGPSVEQASRPLRVMLPNGFSVLLYFAGDRRVNCRAPSSKAWGSNLIQPSRDMGLIRMIRSAFPDDMLAVVLHWGWELQPWPEPGQRRYAAALAAAGVDVLIGHHAHICQAWEHVDGMTAFYGIGNFLVREGFYEAIDVKYPRESSRSVGIMLGASGPRVVHLHADSRRGLVTQIGTTVPPEDSLLESFAGIGDPGSADYSSFYRKHNTVAWWYPVWSGDESRARRVLAESRLRGVGALKRLRSAATSTQRRMGPISGSLASQSAGDVPGGVDISLGETGTSEGEPRGQRHPRGTGG